MITDLTRIPDRLDAARDHNVVAARIVPPGSNAKGLAVIVLTGDAAAAAADGGGLDPNGRRAPAVSTEATPKRLSVHLEFVDPDRHEAAYQKPLDAQGEDVSAPRPPSLPAPGPQPMAAAPQSGTAEAHRAVAAYTSQIEQYNRLRYESNVQTQHVRMRA